MMIFTLITAILGFLLLLPLYIDQFFWPSIIIDYRFYWDHPNFPRKTAFWRQGPATGVYIQLIFYGMYLASWIYILVSKKFSIVTKILVTVNGVFHIFVDFNQSLPLSTVKIILTISALVFVIIDFVKYQRKAD